MADLRVVTMAAQTAVTTVCSRAGKWVVSKVVWTVASLVLPLESEWVG